MSHTHEAQTVKLTEQGTRWEICACGATRVTAHGKSPAPWHTCALCTHSFGLVSS